MCTCTTRDLKIFRGQGTEIERLYRIFAPKSEDDECDLWKAKETLKNALEKRKTVCGNPETRE